MMLYRLHNDAVTYKPIEASDPYEAIRLMRQEQWENAQITWFQVWVDGNYHHSIIEQVLTSARRS